MASIINAATSGGLISTADTSGILQLQTAGTTAVTVDASQNVGIGTTSPAYKLDVSSGTNTYLRAISTVASDAGWYFSNTARSWITFVNGADGAYRWYDATASAERARIPSTGGIQSVNSISVGNATPTTSGAGITFPATQSASTDANTLDDYEEGTWTPVISSSSGTLTSYTSSGKYTKIGRSVTVSFIAEIVTTGTASGTMRIDSFPFTDGNSMQIAALAREQSTGIDYQAFKRAGDTAGHIRSLTEGSIVWTAGQIYQFGLTYFV